MPPLDALQAAIQVTCLAAASVQAGYMETGRDSRLRRPLQVLALALFLAAVVLNNPAVAVRVFSP